MNVTFVYNITYLYFTAKVILLFCDRWIEEEVYQNRCACVSTGNLTTVVLVDIQSCFQIGMPPTSLKTNPIKEMEHEVFVGSFKLKRLESRKVVLVSKRDVN